MADKDSRNNAQYILEKKNVKRVTIAASSLIIIIFLVAFIKHGSLVNSKILSDYFFIAGIVLLIVGALTRTFAWIVHKRSIIKPGNENEDDIIKAKLALKFLSKILSIIGFVNIVVSIIFAVLYYNV